MQAKPRKRDTPDFGFGHRRVSPNKPLIRQAEGKSIIGQRSRVLDEKSAEGIKYPPGQPLRWTGCNGLLRIREPFPHRYGHAAQPSPAKLFAQVLRRNLSRQDKDLFMSAHLSRQIASLPVRAHKAHVLPRGMQLGAEVRHRADATAFLDQVLWKQTTQLFRPAVKAHIAGEHHADRLELRVFLEKGSDLFRRRCCESTAGKLWESVEHPLGADQTVTVL